MKVSEVFAMGGGSGYDPNVFGSEGGPVFTGTRYTYRYYRERLVFSEGDYGGGFNGGFRNESFSGGRGLTGVRG
jgi:hypothetical protein